MAADEILSIGFGFRRLFFDFYALAFCLCLCIKFPILFIVGICDFTSTYTSLIHFSAVLRNFAIFMDMT